MKINLFKLFKKENSLQEIYPMSSFDILLEPKNSYPFFASLKNNNVQAYSARFMVKYEDVIKIENLIELFFLKKITQKKECVSFNGKALHYFRFEEFNQTVIDITTNNIDLIKMLFDERLTPPGPDVVFPNSDFESLGSLQGSMEYWWNVYWSPFWKVQSEQEKKIYFLRNNISNDLRDFMILHS